MEGDASAPKQGEPGPGPTSMDWRRGRIQWMLIACALLALVGAVGYWGTLSVVPAQIEVATPTRWILASLCLVAGTLAWLTGRRNWLMLVACGVFLAVAFLGWTEWRYEKHQAWTYDAANWPWGLFLVQLGGGLGVALSLAGFFVRQRAKKNERPLGIESPA